jgi:hypothetical protein
MIDVDQMGLQEFLNNILALGAPDAGFQRLIMGIWC